MTIYTRDRYMPGFVHEPLSRIALKSDMLMASAAVPFSDDLRTQHGQEIKCLPFTHTPFPLLSLCRQMSDTYWHVGPTFRIKPSTVMATMMAAYPVLVPVYLVEHELQDTASFTVILEAADSWGYYINDDYFRLLAQGRVSVPSTRATTDSLLPVSPVINAIQYMKTFTNITIGPLAPKATIGITRDNVTGAVSKLINDIAFSEGAMAAYENRFFSDSAARPSQPIDWDDLRIREFTMGEVWMNSMWAKLDAQRHGIGQLLRRVKEHSDESGQGERVLPSPLRSAHEWIDKETNDDRPAWLKQWHNRPDKKDDGFT
ncbi:hypothetical protein DAEQUDRAFT_808547 [Daedalea quercina L-15889]|uniref:Uncharacterized protein n=1 Tax=Daedalea quercina L-15889 TaxID=1314783 RepID=A0A165T6I5_9APHY|nr:hypothetical protein DAEQUDRAFT_808547 [Daedalea quercina L-15889]